MTDGVVLEVTQNLGIASVEVIEPEQGALEVELTAQPVTVEVSSIGVQGPPGPAGPSSDTYIHTQASPEAVWTITHNLGFRPGISATDTSGYEVEGSVLHLSDNQLRITFSAAFAGRANLN